MTGDTGWPELTAAVDELRRAADRCEVLATDEALEAPVVALLTARVTALVEELVWEVASPGLPPVPGDGPSSRAPAVPS